VVNAHTCDGVASDQGDSVASEDPVAALKWQLGGSWGLESDGATPGKEMNFPGAVSNCLLTKCESPESVCNRTATMDEMRVALGRKC
jgi:hypothetical protein